MLSALQGLNGAPYAKRIEHEVAVQFVGPSYDDRIITDMHLPTWCVACRGHGELGVGKEVVKM